MSIQSEITRITNKRNQSFTKIASKGVTVPSGSTIDDLPDLIDLIEVHDTYSITKILSNVTSSNDDAEIIAGNSFYMDLTPTSGYVISSITVTMGGVDVTEQVFKPGTSAKSITANGVYIASDDALSGYDRVVVNVPSSAPNLGTKSITENGTYNASDDSLDGYSSVIVDIPASGGSSEESIVKTTSTIITSECNWYAAWQSLGFKFQYQKSTVLVVAFSANTQTSGGNYTNNNMTISHNGTAVVSPRESRWYYQQKTSQVPLNDLAFRIDNSSYTWYYGAVATIQSDGSISPGVSQTNTIMIPAGALLYAFEFPRSTSNGTIDLTPFGG